LDIACNKSPEYEVEVTERNSINDQTNDRKLSKPKRKLFHILTNERLLFTVSFDHAG
jgi:hypothetical protein